MFGCSAYVATYDCIKSSTYMKCWKLERGFRSENSIVEPSLRPEILRIVPPDILHSAHGISYMVDSISFLHFESVRKDVILACTNSILGETN